MVTASTIQDLLRGDRNVTGEAALWATVIADVVNAGQRGDLGRVENFMRDGPLDVVAHALMISEDELKTLIRKTINGGHMKTQTQKKPMDKVPDFDLIGIEAIEGFCGKSSLTLNAWRIHYDFPMTKRSIWRSRRAEIEAWAAERGRPVSELTTDLVHAHWERQKWEREIADGTAEVLNGNLQDIGKKVNIPASSLAGWMSFADFPIEKNGKNLFRTTRQALSLWLQKHPGERRTFGNAVEYRF